MIGLVVTVLLCGTLLACSLLSLPGAVRHQVKRYSQIMESIYQKESALISQLEQFPPDYFQREPWNMKFPPVQNNGGFPWGTLTAQDSLGAVSVFVGVPFRALSREETKELAQELRRNLEEKIKGNTHVRKTSGNRRIRGRQERLSIENTAGDLTLEIEEHVQVGNVWNDGDVRVGGSARYDTLRLYAAGNVSLTGNVTVGHLELFSGGNGELSRQVSFSGIVYARGDVLFLDKASMKFPAVAVAGGRVTLGGAMTSGAPGEMFCSDSSFGGLRVVSVSQLTTSSPLRASAPQKHRGAPEQRLRAVSSQSSLKQGPSGCILPVFLGGKMQPIRWSYP